MSLEQESTSIKEEYQLWRKNCRYMYDFVSETALTWPSITVQWMPNHTDLPDNAGTEASLLLGTHTSGSDTDYIKVATTQLPLRGIPSQLSTRLKIIKKLENSCEINRARYMPQDPNIVASINGKGEVDVYDIKNNTKVSLFTPHTQNGYGLAWSLFERAHLLSASDDGSVAITNTNTKDEILRDTSSKTIVNDAQWHKFDSHMFATGSDDEIVRIYDTRTASNGPSLQYVAKGSTGINSVAFSFHAHNLLAIGNANSNIELLDIRKMESPQSVPLKQSQPPSKTPLLHTMMGHGDAVTCMEFSPHNDGVLASGAQDRRVILWDLARIGEEQQQEDAEDGCPELFMMHAGHTGQVSDINWCPYRAWTVASVADDNVIHIWDVGTQLLKGDEPETSVDPSTLE